MSEFVYEVPFGNTLNNNSSNFDAEFQEISCLYRDIQSMVVDTDGTIHLFLSSGEEVVYTQIKNRLDLLSIPISNNEIDTLFV